MPRSFSAAVMYCASRDSSAWNSREHFDAVSIVNQVIKDVPVQQPLLTDSRSSVHVILRNPPWRIVTTSGKDRDALQCWP